MERITEMIEACTQDLNDETSNTTGNTDHNKHVIGYVQKWQLAVSDLLYILYLLKYKARIFSLRNSGLIYNLTQS
jgi:hypothetical protein